MNYKWMTGIVLSLLGGVGLTPIGLGGTTTKEAVMRNNFAEGSEYCQCKIDCRVDDAAKHPDFHTDQQKINVCRFSQCVPVKQQYDPNMVLGFCTQFNGDVVHLK